MAHDGEAPPRSLRILVVNWLDREHPRSGGAETHLHETFGRLVERGHSVAALVSGWAGCLPGTTLDGVGVHRFRYATDRWERLSYRGGLLGRSRTPAGLALCRLWARVVREDRDVSPPTVPGDHRS